MYYTLLLRLAAPLQSWGVDSSFEKARRTCREPTKSGVIGLLASALGRRRDESPDDLNALRFGVRVDQEGKYLRDFHMAQADGGASYITYRYYLSDAVFVAGLESDDRDFLISLEQALTRPVFPLFLGRRSCPPTLPLLLGVRDARLEDALQNEPSQISEWRRSRMKGAVNAESPARILIESSAGEPGATMIQDVAISFSPFDRQYGYRYVLESASKVNKTAPGDQPEHDPMAELR